MLGESYPSNLEKEVLKPFLGELGLPLSCSFINNQVWKIGKRFFAKLLDRLVNTLPPLLQKSNYLL